MSWRVSEECRATHDRSLHGFGCEFVPDFRHVILPNIATALLAGGMLAFALSFDEVIVTTFTAGQQSDPADLDLQPNCSAA